MKDFLIIIFSSNNDNSYFFKLNECEKIDVIIKKKKDLDELLTFQNIELLTNFNHKYFLILKDPSKLNFQLVYDYLLNLKNTTLNTSNIFLSKNNKLEFKNYENNFFFNSINETAFFKKIFNNLKGNLQNISNVNFNDFSIFTLLFLTENSKLNLINLNIKKDFNTFKKDFLFFTRKNFLTKNFYKSKKIIESLFAQVSLDKHYFDHKFIEYWKYLMQYKKINFVYQNYIFYNRNNYLKKKLLKLFKFFFV